jgi:hypothetical protein
VGNSAGPFSTEDVGVAVPPVFEPPERTSNHDGSSTLTTYGPTVRDDEGNTGTSKYQVVVDDETGAVLSESTTWTSEPGEPGETSETNTSSVDANNVRTEVDQKSAGNAQEGGSWSTTTVTDLNSGDYVQTTNETTKYIDTNTGEPTTSNTTGVKSSDGFSSSLTVTTGDVSGASTSNQETTVPGQGTTVTQKTDDGQGNVTVHSETNNPSAPAGQQKSVYDYSKSEDGSSQSSWDSYDDNGNHNMGNATTAADGTTVYYNVMYNADGSGGTVTQVNTDGQGNGTQTVTTFDASGQTTGVSTTPVSGDSSGTGSDDSTSSGDNTPEDDDSWSVLGVGPGADVYVDDPNPFSLDAVPGEGPQVHLPQYNTGDPGEDTSGSALGPFSQVYVPLYNVGDPGEDQSGSQLGSYAQVRLPMFNTGDPGDGDSSGSNGSASSGPNPAAGHDPSLGSRSGVATIRVGFGDMLDYIENAAQQARVDD